MVGCGRRWLFILSRTTVERICPVGMPLKLRSSGVANRASAAREEARLRAPRQERARDQHVGSGLGVDAASVDLARSLRRDAPHDDVV